MRILPFLFCLVPALLSAQQQPPMQVTGWRMQDVAKVSAPGAQVSAAAFSAESWYPATVPGTVLTTLVDNHVYPEPLFGENMRPIPESLNKTSYWYRTSLPIPRADRGRHTWLHFAGINYAAEVWVNGRSAGSIHGAFTRGDFDISPFVQPGRTAVVAVLVSPQPHPGIPIEHTVANGVGTNGGITALDGPTFLSTIGWDWLPAIRDRDTGIWLPVTLDSTGPVTIVDPYIRSTLAPDHASAALTLSTSLRNLTAKPVTGTLTATIEGHGPAITVRKEVTLAPDASTPIQLDPATSPELRVGNPALWWPNGYGKQDLYTLHLTFAAGKSPSDEQTLHFGIRDITYQVSDSENLTISVNGVRIMVRGGNWGLDEGLKRIPRARLDAQFHLHALAHMNLIRNWVGQSTSPDFYDMADKYGMLLWDEFFQPNPSDGPDPDNIPLYLANVTDKVVRFRNHPSIAVWCARNEGYPPPALDAQLKSMMSTLDPTRLYQSNSADGRGVHSGGPYYWRAPRFFYRLGESFKTETGSVSIPTIESIQGMLPRSSWETQDNAWAQHDLAHGAQRGDEYPGLVARRYGPVRNLADFARKSQLMNYEAYRAMYEGRNAEMFTATSGVITWMSHPAQPSFVWQLYHYDLEPNSSLFAVQKASEPIHIQLNESNGAIEIVNNHPEALTGLSANTTIYSLAGKVESQSKVQVASVPASSTRKIAQIDVPSRISPVYFVKLDLTGPNGLISTNFYWQNVEQDDFTSLAKLDPVTLNVAATQAVTGDRTLYTVTLTNPTDHIALMTHLQLHHLQSGTRVLPIFPSDNYLSLVPGESRTVTLDIATADLKGEQPLLLIDGYNVNVTPVEGPVTIRLNQNAQPANTPASNLVP